MLTELFEYRFVAPLSFPLAHELRLLTGMLIGDIGNPHKDTPGSSQFAGNVHLTLERGEHPDLWYLSAFTHDLSGADLPAVALLHAQLRLVLTALTYDVGEVLVSPLLPTVAPLPDRAGLISLGDGMAKAKRFDQAITAYTCALALSPDDWYLRGKRAVCLRWLGRLPDALSDYIQAVSLAPAYARLYSMRASVYIDMGRDLDALADLEQAQALEPANPDYRVKAGLLYYQHGAYAPAADAFSSALKFCAQGGDLYYYRGCAEMQLDHVRSAADDFAQAVRRSATLEQIQLSDVLVNLVAMLVRIPDAAALELASGAVTQLLAMGVTDPTPATLYLWRADINRRLGNYAASVADCDQALTLAPADPRLYNVKGIALGDMHKLGDALAAFSQAAILAPNSLGYVHNRAITLGLMGRHAAALAEYSRALLLDPHSARLYSERGEMYAAFGSDALAEADYRVALALAPDDLPTMLRLGALLAKRGDLLMAMGYLDRVIAQDSADLRQVARSIRDQLYDQTAWVQATAPISPPAYDDTVDPRDIVMRSVPPHALAAA